MKDVLVIAYGNPLRCDDGIAWQAVEHLKRELPESARVICVHQLTPELAETASTANLVIFMDAATHGDPGTVTCQPLAPEPGPPRFSHFLSPQEVLAMCEQVYSTKPRGFLVSIHGERFDHGQDFSPASVRALPQAVSEVTRLLKSLGNLSGSTLSVPQ